MRKVSVQIVSMIRHEYPILGVRCFYGIIFSEKGKSFIMQFKSGFKSMENHYGQTLYRDGIPLYINLCKL